MSRARTSVHGGALIARDGEAELVVPVGGPAWEAWLNRPEADAFRFADGPAPYTARRQSHRGRWYWYAYRRRGGRLRKLYLGRPADLTLDRLVAVGERFAALDGTTSSPHEHRSSAELSVPPEPSHNLPRQLTSFLGRQTERTEVRQLLETARMVTLTGAGGVGKTRLALQIAAELPPGMVTAIWLVELANVADPTLVPQAVAEAAGIREVPGEALLATLTAGLGVAPLLLILDNCEHLVDSCARVAEHLLHACPELRLLATSREPLGVPGEVTWRVPSLGLPEPSTPPAAQPDAEPAEAVRLFVERAQSVRPGFALSDQHAAAVGTICRWVDGIPLAIELAATQMRLLSPTELAARLDGRSFALAGGTRTAPPRHRTLQATIDWSYDLLTQEERRCFAWLSVFAGGFSLEAAEAVCADPGAGAVSILDLVSRLVDRSLVQVEPGGDDVETRYRLLEPLRAYGAERLEQRGEAAAARTRHANWITGQAEQAARAFHGPQQGFWLRWAEREHGNARAALAWAVDRKQTDLAARLAAAIAWSWLVHQRWSEGLEWVQRILALPSSSPTQERGRLLVQAVQLTAFRGDLTSNRPAAGIDLETARRWIEECLAISEALDDEYLRSAGRGLRELLRELGIAYDGIPELDRDEELAELRQSGNTWGMRRSLEAKSRDALQRGDFDLAITHLQQVIVLARKDGDSWSLAIGLNQLGDIERARGRHSRAKPLYEESASIFTDELGLGAQPNLLHNLGYVALASGDPAAAGARFTAALGQFRRLGERRGAAECLLGLGAVAIAERRLADGGRLFGAGEAILAELTTEIWPANRPDVERWLARAQTSRAAADFDRERTRSRALPVAEATIGSQVETPAPGITSTQPVSHLTPREQAVARLVAAGLSNREVAASLAIAEKTASNHVQRLLEKLDLRSRAQLAARAAELGIVPAESATAADHAV